MTIKDIARVCGVSISTVSRVLNERPDVSGEVRCRVLEAVEKYGYIPNNSARDLVRSQSANIGGVVRGNKVFIAVGNMELSAYDRVVVFAMPASISKIGYFFN